MQTLEEYLVEELGADYPSPGVENVMCCCIACGREKKFGVNVNTGLAQCWVCEYTANITRIIIDLEGLPFPQAVMKGERLLKGIARRKMVVAQDTTFVNAIRGIVEGNASRKTEAKEVNLPTFSMPIDDAGSGFGRKYLEKRKISPKKYARYQLHFVQAPDPSDNRYFRHIVFPEYNNAGDLTFFTTRAAYEPEHGPKSYHREGPKDALYGLHSLQVVRNDGVILVEGPMDVLALSGHAVGLLGKDITIEQKKLLEQNFSRVWVCLDREEVLGSWNLAKELHGIGLDTYLVHPPLHDAAESAEVPARKLAAAILKTAKRYTPSEHIKIKLRHTR